MIHAQGQADEELAIAEGKLLEKLGYRGLVELDWVSGRKATLDQIKRGQISGVPLRVTTSTP